jgi:hypothetical protein
MRLEYLPTEQVAGWAAGSAPVENAATASSLIDFADWEAIELRMNGPG